ncbi:MAG: polysaccharide lyase 8 family protein [Acidobacteria bacterium]|nr:polysaccharide lyase 8 family protein [Acidobacteriota bacterium]
MKRVLILVLAAVALHGGEFDDLRLRWRNTLTGGEADLSLPQVRARLASIESTARAYWDRIDKNTERRVLWPDLAGTTDSGDITGNFRRIYDMSLAWATPGQRLYGNAELLATVRSALDWMEANRYHARVTNKYDNWWHWEIGSPIELGNTLTLLQDALTPDEIARQAAAIDRFVGDPRIMVRSTVSTGANRVWKCKAAMLRAIAVRDEAKMKLSSDALEPVFAYVTAGDGFYQDGSFIQHARHPYTGGYGKALLADIADLLYLLTGSRWEFRGAGRDNLYRWVFEAFQPLVYRGAMMDMVRGREVSRSGSTDHAVGHSTAAAVLRVAQFAPPGIAASMRAMVKEWYLSDTSRDWATGRTIEEIMAIRRLLSDAGVPRRGEGIGSWVFAGMDRIVHRRHGWAFGIAMHSSRVYNYESINRENLRAWHTADGMTFLYNSDLTQFSDQYWPTVDPQRLPGTTVIAGSTPRQSQFGGSDIAGGVTVNGFTAAMMHLRTEALQAKKSWFLFDNEVVAVGSDIRAAEGTANVQTIVENRLIHGQPSFSRGEDGGWAHLAQGEIGYVFPASKEWKQSRENRAGAWSLINTAGSAANVTRQYQTLWFDHRPSPAGASYVYALLPGASRIETEAYAAGPNFRVLEKSATAHAVVEDWLGIRAVTFWQNDTHTAAGITSDRVAAVLVQLAGGALSIGIADPSQSSAEIHLEVEGAVGAVLDKDEAVTVVQTAPSLKLAVRTQAARGRTLQAKFQVH